MPGVHPAGKAHENIFVDEHAERKVFGEHHYIDFEQGVYTS